MTAILSKTIFSQDFGVFLIFPVVRYIERNREAGHVRTEGKIKNSPKAEEKTEIAVLRAILSVVMPVFASLRRGVHLRFFKISLIPLKLRRSEAKTNGERGIRTLGTGINQYNGLANRRFRPLSHLSQMLIISNLKITLLCRRF